MKTSGNPNKVTAQVQYEKAIEGVDKYLATTASIVVASTTYTPAELKSALQGGVDAEKAVDQSRAQYRQQVVVATPARAKARAARNVVKKYVLTTYGDQAVSVLEAFGIPVPKPRGGTAASRSAGALKAAATRKARREAAANAPKGGSAPPAPAPQATGTPAKS